MQVVKFLDIVLPEGALRHHSPNEGMHKAHYRAKQSRLGMLSGWPDLELIVPTKGFKKKVRPAPIFIELKSATGRLSDNQKVVLQKLDEAGAYTMVCRSVAEVADFLKGLLKIKC